MKILTILGARPQFIKAGSVSREVANFSEIEEVIVHTGQHYDSNMSDIFFSEMKIPKPNYYLGIGNMTHGAMTGRMIEKIEEVALKESPDWILVYGDTNSTLAGALVASKLKIKLAHIEAGLRSFNMNMPEEVNRILTDRVSQLLFCPTITAVNNLQKEGFDSFNCEVVNSGDVMLDGANFYRQYAVKPSSVTEKEFILATIHRAENTDDIEKLTGIINSLNEINKKTKVIVPLHPRTQKIIEDNNINIEFQIIKPVGYLEMIWLIDNCNLIMTDSGGLQKEAYFFQKPCITLRDETEWTELVENKFNILAGSKKEVILNIFENKDSLFNTNYSLNLYGDGMASRKILQSIVDYTKLNS